MRSERTVWGAHRPFGIALLAYLLLRVGTAWYIDEFALLAQDYNALNIVELARHHDIPAIDDMEAGAKRDFLAFSSLYWLTGWSLDHVGISPRALMVLHHVLGPPLLAAAMYAAGWILFASAEIAWLTVLVLLYADFSWFQVNVGYPILFNQMLYYGDVNHVVAAALIVALLARRFLAAGAAAVILSLLNAPYGFNAALCLVVLWIACRVTRWREPGLTGAVAVAIGGCAAGYGLPLLVLWRARETPAPAAARDVAIRTYGHIAIHAWDVRFYIIGVACVVAVLVAALLLERYGARRALGGRRGWFERVAASMLLVTLVQGILAYWVLFIGWPSGLMAASPSKILMVAALFACPYVAYGMVRLVHMAPPVGVLAIGGGIVLLTTHRVLPYVLMCGAAVAVAGLLPFGAALRRGHSIRAWTWPIIALMCADTLVASSRVFAGDTVAKAAELKAVSRQIRAAVPPDAVLVPFRFGAHVDNPFGPFSNLPLRTFSRRAYLPYWALGRNAYFNSMQRHEAEERAFTAASLSYWPDVLQTLDTERRAHPFEYYTGLRLRTRPCCGMDIGVAMPSRVTAEKRARLHTFVTTASLEAFAEYAARLGGTHLFIVREAAVAVPWGPVLAESPHFVVIPIPPPARASSR